MIILILSKTEISSRRQSAIYNHRARTSNKFTAHFVLNIKNLEWKKLFIFINFQIFLRAFLSLIVAIVLKNILVFFKNKLIIKFMILGIFMLTILYIKNLYKNKNQQEIIKLKKFFNKKL